MSDTLKLQEEMRAKLVQEIVGVAELSADVLKEVAGGMSTPLSRAVQNGEPGIVSCGGHQIT